MREQLAGPGVTAARALAAAGAVYGGVEVIDSRYRDFRFTLPDVVADKAVVRPLRNRSGGPAARPAGPDPGGMPGGGQLGRSPTRPPARPCRASGGGARAGRQRTGPPGARDRAGLDRPHRRHDRCRSDPARGHGGHPLHAPRLGPAVWRLTCWPRVKGAEQAPEPWMTTDRVFHRICRSSATDQFST